MGSSAKFYDEFKVGMDSSFFHGTLYLGNGYAEIKDYEIGIDSIGVESFARTHLVSVDRGGVSGIEIYWSFAGELDLQAFVANVTNPADISLVIG